MRDDFEIKDDGFEERRVAEGRIDVESRIIDTMRTDKRCMMLSQIKMYY